MKKSVVFLLLFSCLVNAQTKDRSTNVLRYTGYRSSCEITIRNDAISAITGLIARWDSSNKASVIDENGVNANSTAFTNKVKTWEDVSNSGNSISYNLEATVDDNGQDHPPTYTPNTIDRPDYRQNSHIGAPTKDVHMQSTNTSPLVENNDFTFVFVMRSNVLEADLPGYPSLLSSVESTNSSIGAWQFGYSNRNKIPINHPQKLVDFEKPVADGGYGYKPFCLVFNPRGLPSTTTINTLAPYDNETHVWIFKYNYNGPTNTTIKIVQDGVELVSLQGKYELNIELVKLFKNRTSDVNAITALDVDFFEFFLYNRYLSDTEITTLSDVLKCKWGVLQ